MDTPNQFFDDAFAYLLHDEGTSFIDRTNDDGGPTKFGITLLTLSQWLGRKVSTDDVKNLSQDTAKQIYLKNYWQLLSCDRLLSEAIAICLFDTGVLYGIGSTAIMAQKALNANGATLKVDGVIGPECVKRLNVIDPVLFIKTFCGQIFKRINTVISDNPLQAEFRVGWEKRTSRLLALTDVITTPEGPQDV